MADITRQNMVLHRTERTTGGRMGPVEITAGDTDFLFKPITLIGRATGEVEIKGLYAFVSNDGIGQLLKSFMFVSDPPTDENVTVALMTRGEWGDGLADWTNYLTSYLVAGAMISWYPYETTIAGSEVITLWGRPGILPPPVGKTYILRGHPGTVLQVEQAVMITDVATRTELFYDDATRSDYPRQLATVYIETATRYGFVGPAVSLHTPVNPTAVMLDTNPSNAIRIYGISRTTSDIAVGDQVIPAALDETAVIDATSAGNSASLVPAAGGVVEFVFQDNLAEGASIYLGSPALPGTVQIVAGPATLIESGGELKSGDVTVATVNSEAGVVTAVSGAPTYTAPLTVRFQPAGVVTAPVMSREIPVTEATRGTKYTAHLSPPPAPGTIQISYMVDGQWISLYDQGDGTIKGASEAHGRAFLSGLNTVAMTLGFPPDSGSSVIIQWGGSAFRPVWSDRTGDVHHHDRFRIRSRHRNHYVGR
jgi:hypothetical protein